MDGQGGCHSNQLEVVKFRNLHRCQASVKIIGEFGSFSTHSSSQPYPWQIQPSLPAYSANDSQASAAPPYRPFLNASAFSAAASARQRLGADLSTASPAPLHLLDLVAQAGGFFELEVGGGFAHPALHVLEGGLEVGAEEGLGRFGDAGAGQLVEVAGLVGAVEDVLDVALDALGRDAVFEVVGLLLLAAAVGLGDGALHRAGHAVGVEDDAAVDVARGAADGLDQGGLGAQEALLVRVEDGDQAALGDVEALAQQVDADQAVERAQAQVAQDLDPLQGVDVGVHVADAHPLLVHVFGQVLGHLLGQGGDQGAVTRAGGGLHLVDDVVDLVAGGAGDGTDLDRGVDQAGRADDLFGEDAAGLVQLPCAGGGRDEDGLGPHGVPFLELQRAVVDGRGQAEAVFGQGRFAAVVAAIHGADLAHGDVALIHEQQGVVGDVFEEGRRRLARRAAGQPAAVVLDAGAGAGGLHHLQIETGALLQPLGLQQLAVLDHPVERLLQLGLDAVDGLIERRARGDVVAGGVDGDLVQRIGLLAGQGVELVDGLDLVAEQADAPGAVLEVDGEDLQRVAALAEHAALEMDVVALVLQGDEVGAQLGLVDLVADLQAEGHGGIGLDRADAVDATDRGDDDDVVPLQDRAGGGVAHPVDLLVNRRVLLDVGVGARDVGLGLVVVVIADEILDGVVGEEGLELGIELGRQRLVVGQDQGRALGLFDHLGHGEGLARAGDAQQHLLAIALVRLGHKLGDGRGLVPRGLVFRLQPEGDALLVGRPVGAVRDPVGGGGGGLLRREARAAHRREHGRTTVVEDDGRLAETGIGRVDGLGQLLGRCRGRTGHEHQGPRHEYASRRLHHRDRRCAAWRADRQRSDGGLHRPHRRAGVRRGAARPALERDRGAALRPDAGRAAAAFQRLHVRRGGAGGAGRGGAEPRRFAASGRGGDAGGLSGSGPRQRGSGRAGRGAAGGVQLSVRLRQRPDGGQGGVAERRCGAAAGLRAAEDRHSRLDRRLAGEGGRRADRPGSGRPSAVPLLGAVVASGDCRPAGKHRRHDPGREVVHDVGRQRQCRLGLDLGHAGRLPEPADRRRGQARPAAGGAVALAALAVPGGAAAGVSVLLSGEGAAGHFAQISEPERPAAQDHPLGPAQLCEPRRQHPDPAPLPHRLRADRLRARECGRGRQGDEVAADADAAEGYRAGPVPSARPEHLQLRHRDERGPARRGAGTDAARADRLLHDLGRIPALPHGLRQERPSAGGAVDVAGGLSADDARAGFRGHARLAAGDEGASGGGPAAGPGELGHADVGSGAVL
uniref:NAD-specific glutamate dehydrogenase n=1 Tax=Parastrongyloides trichosuri TaxID=131310 RepID=A0A0N5A6Y0_PARTI